MLSFLRCKAVGIFFVFRKERGVFTWLNEFDATSEFEVSISHTFNPYIQMFSLPRSVHNVYVFPITPGFWVSFSCFEFDNFHIVTPPHGPHPHLPQVSDWKPPKLCSVLLFSWLVALRLTHSWHTNTHTHTHNKRVGCVSRMWQLST